VEREFTRRIKDRMGENPLRIESKNSNKYKALRARKNEATVKF